MQRSINPKSIPTACSDFAINTAFSRNTRQICLVFRLNAVFMAKSEQAVGIDFGLMDLCILSTGERIPNLRVARHAEREVARKRRAFAPSSQASRGVLAKE